MEIYASGNVVLLNGITFGLFIFSVLNGCTRRGPSLGNSLGVLGKPENLDYLLLKQELILPFRFGCHIPVVFYDITKQPCLRKLEFQAFCGTILNGL